MKHLISCQSSLDELWHKIRLSNILCSKQRKSSLVPGICLKAIHIMTQSRENCVVKGLDPDSPTFPVFVLISYCCMHEICTFLGAILRALNEIKCHEIKAIDTCRPEAGIRHSLAFLSASVPRRLRRVPGLCVNWPGATIKLFLRIQNDLDRHATRIFWTDWLY